MAWLAVDKDGDEYIYRDKPGRQINNYWYAGEDHFVELPKGSIKKLIGKELSWDDEPVELRKE